MVAVIPTCSSLWVYLDFEGLICPSFGGLLPFRGAAHPLNRKYQWLYGNAIPPFWGLIYLAASPLKRK